MQIMGLNILINDELMSNTVEDWSNVRSYARAKRRLKRGFQQRISYRKAPKAEFIRLGESIIMHSEMYKEVVRKLDSNHE